MAILNIVKHVYARTRRARRCGFTFVEMIMVITLISILATISTSGIKSAREKARRTNCMSNLRQMGVAIVAYRTDNGGRNPPWLSNLFPSYLDDLSVYVCRSDLTKGRGLTPASVDGGMRKYANPIDNISRARPADQNTDVEANSYFYEFSNSPCEFDSSRTWAEYKEWELREGNGGKPFSSAKMPIVRCFHHAPYTRIDSYPFNGSGVPNKNSALQKSGLTVNVAYAGNVTIAPLWWQGTVDIGDEKNK